VSRYHSYLNSAKQILHQFRGEEPFASFIKRFFSQQKKYGSKDRKQISHLCYSYFRLGKAGSDLPVDERILLSLFLCSTESNDILEQLKPEWNEKAKRSLEEKLSSIHYQLSPESVFPWAEKLSEGIDHRKFCESFFIQPDLFLRLRPGKEKNVIEKLQDAGIMFKKISSSCLALPNATKVENIIELDKEAVVQDYNSQGVGDFFQTAGHLPSVIRAWDCCAASGGKSLLLYDINPTIDLTVSDVRKSILINLEKRFEKAGIENYNSFVADLSTGQTAKSDQTGFFDLIICDAPCTGSGTWSRTPEQLFYFNEIKIEQYASLQKKILLNAVDHLKAGGYFLYITCSVFKKENEEIADFIRQEFRPELIKMELLKGYDKKADTMFAALFRKSIA